MGTPAMPVWTGRACNNSPHSGPCLVEWTVGGLAGAGEVRRVLSHLRYFDKIAESRGLGGAHFPAIWRVRQRSGQVLFAGGTRVHAPPPPSPIFRYQLCLGVPRSISGAIP